MAAGFCEAGWAPAMALRRLIATQARANALGELFDVIGLLDSAHRDDVAIVLFEIDLELFGKLGKLSGVFQVGFVLGFEDFVALEFAVGQALFGRRSGIRAALGKC